MKRLAWLLMAVAITFAANVARAEGEEAEPAASEGGYGYRFGLAFTIGEGFYVVDNEVWRGPVSLEIVPSLGWEWFKFDLGLAVTLESIEIAGTDVGHWSFSFRPGGRLTPPMIPLYFRVAFPLILQVGNFQAGIMFGVGVDIPIFKILGIVFEIDTTLNDDLSWGVDGMPLEFRLGLSLHF